MEDIQFTNAYLWLYGSGFLVKCEGTIQRFKRERGNICQICGWDKYPEILVFHHIDPEEKDFNLSEMVGKYSLEEIGKEVEKCLLVCQNCHFGIHIGLIKISI